MASSSNYQAWVEVVPEFKGFNKSVRQESERSLSAAGDEGGKTFGKGLSGALGKIAVPLAIAGAAAVAGVGLAAGTALTKGLNRSLSIQDAQAKLTGLGHSGESVQAIMTNALDSVRGTAFGLGDAAGVAAGAVASGIEPGEKLTRVLKLTADAATIAGTDLNSMGSIFNKVAASGKLQGDVIAQLQDAGVPVLQFVAKQMGVTAGEAAKLASEGKVSFETFADAMEQGLGGAALSSGKTARGAFANLEAALGRFGAQFTTPLVEAAPAFFTALTGAIDLAAGAAAPFAQQFGIYITAKLEEGAGKITNFTARMGEMKDGLGGLKDLIGKGDFTSALGDAFKIEEDSPFVGFVLAARDAVITFKDAFAGFGEGTDLPGLLTDLGTAFSPLATIFKGIEPVLPQITAGIAGFARVLGDGLLDAAQQLLPPITQLATAISQGLTDALTDPELQTSLGELFSALSQLGGQVLPIVVPLIADLVTAVTPLVPIIADLVSQGLPILVDLLTYLVTPTRESGTGAADLGTALVSVGAAIGFLLQLLPGGLVAFQGLKDALTGAKSASEITAEALDGKYGIALQSAAKFTIGFGDTVYRAFVKIGQTADEKLGQVQAVGQRVWSSLPAPVQSALSTIGTTVSTGISGAVSTLASLPGRALAALSGLGGTLVGAGRSLVEGFVSGITGGIQSAANAAARVARAAVDAAKAALDINSPSRVFRDEVGLMVGLGMAEGIDRSAGAVSRSVAGLAVVPDVPGSSFAYDASVAPGYSTGSAPAGDTTINVYEAASANATAIAVARRQNGFAV